MDSKENKKPFKCPICPATFSHKGNLPRHIATIHQKKKATGDSKEVLSNLTGETSIFFDRE